MSNPLWPNEKILATFAILADRETGDIQPNDVMLVFFKMRDEMQEKIDALEREAEALAQGYREILAELEEKSK